MGRPKLRICCWCREGRTETRPSRLAIAIFIVQAAINTMLYMKTKSVHLKRNPPNFVYCSLTFFFFSFYFSTSCFIFTPHIMSKYSSFLQVITHADKFPHEFDPKNPDEVHHTIPFRMDSHIVGRVLPSVLAHLVEYNNAQRPSPFEIVEGSHVSFATWVDCFDKRTQVMKELLDTWREHKVFPVLAGNETYGKAECEFI